MHSELNIFNMRYFCEKRLSRVASSGQHAREWNSQLYIFARTNLSNNIIKSWQSERFSLQERAFSAVQHFVLHYNKKVVSWKVLRSYIVSAIRFGSNPSISRKASVLKQTLVEHTNFATHLGYSRTVSLRLYRTWALFEKQLFYKTQVCYR